MLVDVTSNDLRTLAEFREAAAASVFNSRGRANGVSQGKERSPLTSSSNRFSPLVDDEEDDYEDTVERTSASALQTIAVEGVNTISPVRKCNCKADSNTTCARFWETAQYEDMKRQMRSLKKNARRKKMCEDLEASLTYNEESGDWDLEAFKVGTHRLCFAAWCGTYGFSSTTAHRNKNEVLILSRCASCLYFN